MRGAKRRAGAAPGVLKRVGTEWIGTDAAGRRVVSPELLEVSRRTGGAHFCFDDTGPFALREGVSLFRHLFINGADHFYPNPMTGVPVRYSARCVRFLCVWTKDITAINLDELREALATRRAAGQPLFALRVNLAITCAGPELERSVPPWRNQLAHVRERLWPFLRDELNYDAEALAHAVSVRVDPVGPWRRADGTPYDPVRAELPALVRAVVALGIGNLHFSFFQADGVWPARIRPKMCAAGFRLYVASDAERVAYIREVILPAVLDSPDLSVTTCSVRPALLRTAAGDRIRQGACVPEAAVRVLGEAVDYDAPARLGSKKSSGDAERIDLCTCVAIRDAGYTGTRTGRAFCLMDCAYCFTGPGLGTWAAALQPKYDRGAEQLGAAAAAAAAL